MTVVEFSDPFIDSIQLHDKGQGNEPPSSIAVESQFRDCVKNILTELRLENNIDRVYFESRYEEEADNAPIVGWIDKGKKEVKMIMPDCPDLHYFEGAVRHELYHIYDELDKDFAYIEEHIHTYGELWFYYMFVWNVYIDSRIIRNGKKTLYSKEGRLEELKMTLKCHNKHLENIEDEFEKLWNIKEISHPHILTLGKELYEKAK